MVNCFGKLLTKSAFTVSMLVISFGSRARLVSFLYCRNTSPRDAPTEIHCFVRDQTSRNRLESTNVYILYPATFAIDRTFVSVGGEENNKLNKEKRVFFFLELYFIHPWIAIWNTTTKNY